MGLPLGSVLAFQTRLAAHGLWAGLLLAMALIIAAQYSLIGRTVS